MKNKINIKRHSLNMPGKKVYPNVVEVTEDSDDDKKEETEDKENKIYDIGVNGDEGLEEKKEIYTEM